MSDRVNVPIIPSMTGPTDNLAVEALARVIAVQTGMIRATEDGEELEESFNRIRPEGRHGLRELASVYVDVVEQGLSVTEAQERESAFQRERDETIRQVIRYMRSDYGPREVNAVMADFKRAERTAPVEEPSDFPLSDGRKLSPDTGDLFEGGGDE